MDALSAVKTGLFVVLSAPIVWVSRKSIRHPGSHGFYRFFAWEAIALLFVMNVEHWFEEFFSPIQILSSILLTIGLIIVLEAVRLLKIIGRPRDTGESDEYHFEQTTQLVTVGAYRWIRHPMYSSLLFLTWGIYLKNPTPLTTAVAVAATALLYATARADEREDIARFGDEYREYMGATKRFIPFVW